MDLDFDTFLVALYTLIDDLYWEYFAPRKPRRPGHKPEMSDGEVLTLLVLAQWLGNSQRQVIRYAAKHWKAYFPRLLSQSATNRRGRDLAGVLVHLVPLLGRRLGSNLAEYQVLDGVPVPLMRRCRGTRHRLFADEAAVGRAGSDRDFYYGCQLLLAVSDEGVITGLSLGPANTDVRWIADSLLCWRKDPYAEPLMDFSPPAKKRRRSNYYVGPTGRRWPREGAGEASLVPYLADGGLSGSNWAKHWEEDYQALVITPQSYRGRDAKEAAERHRKWRHVIETVNALLDGAFHLAFPRARSSWGLLTRIGAKLAAFNLAMLINRLFGRRDFAVATVFSW